MTELLTLAELLRKHRECGPLAAINVKPDDMVVVAGAYEGTTMKFISDLYGCQVVGFEPQDVHRQRAITLLTEGGNNKWSIADFAIGTENGTFPMGEVGTDAASFVPDPSARTHGEGRMRDAAEIIDMDIALMVLNVEGYEYELLIYLEGKGLLQRIKNLIVQFHDVEPTRHQLDFIHTTILLERTHTFRWHHPQEPSWTWHWWERKS